VRCKIRYNNLNIKEDDLNILQKVSIYHLLKRKLPSSQNIQHWIEQLNLPKNEIQLDKLCLILQWPEKAKNFIHQHNVSYKNIRFLIDHTSDEIDMLFELADLLSLRLIELNNIFNLLSEIALNKNKSIIEVLNIPDIKNILSDISLNRNQKIVAFKTLLQNMRYPLISKYRDEINQKMKELSFSNDVNIITGIICVPNSFAILILLNPSIIINSSLSAIAIIGYKIPTFFIEVFIASKPRLLLKSNS